MLIEVGDPSLQKTEVGNKQEHVLSDGIQGVRTGSCEPILGVS